MYLLTQVKQTHPVYTPKEKIVNLSTRDKVHLKSDCKEGFVVNGVGHPILIIFLR